MSQPPSKATIALSAFFFGPAERAGTRSVGGVYQNFVHGIILSGELCSIHPCRVTYHGLYRTRPSPRAWPLTPFRPSRTCPPRSLASRERGAGGREGGSFTRKEGEGGERREGRIKKGDLHQGESERRVANPVSCLRPGGHLWFYRLRSKINSIIESTIFMSTIFCSTLFLLYRIGSTVFVSTDFCSK